MTAPAMELRMVGATQPARRGREDSQRQIILGPRECQRVTFDRGASQVSDSERSAVRPAPLEPRPRCGPSD